MKAIAAVIDTMRAKGMSDTDILDVVAAMASALDDGRTGVDPQAERRRAADRERKARLRNSAESAESPPSPPCSLPHTPTQNPPYIPPEVVDERLRAADEMVSRIAEAAIPEGHALNGDVMAASVCLGWRRSGFDVDLDAIPGVAKALAGRYRITRWDKLTSWVANHHADRMAAEMARPPPEILQSQAATVTQLRPRNDPISIIDIGRTVAANPPPGYG
jgi:hypothetical protein